MKYHESLDALVGLAVSNKIPLNEKTVFVRDGAGRLMLVSEFVENPREIELAIRASLGGYAAAIALITGNAAKRLIEQGKTSEVEVVMNSRAVNVRYLDRRVVGMDWLRTPSLGEKIPKRLVFASLKGGVGRSTALSILAADLARAGKKVLAIDLDLEAPGIGFMLLPESQETSSDRRPKFGVIDYLLENKINGVLDEELYDFIGLSPFAEGSIDVIPAVGRETDDRPWSMMEKLSRAVTEDHSNGEIVSWAEQVRSMIDRFIARSNYDAVLIDARAGMSEITAAPLLALSAEILLFGTDQPQTFRGYSYLLSHLVAVSEPTCLNELDWRRRLSFVQSKASSAASKRENFRNSLYELCADFLYDEESLEQDGRVNIEGFSPGPENKGIGIPHDSLYIQYHPDYDAFNPVGDHSQLDSEVYDGPFGAFLKSAWTLLDLKRNSRND